MKVCFDEKGMLVISAENNTEMVALKHWASEFSLAQEAASLIAFDWGSYRQKGAIYNTDKVNE